MEKKWFLMSCQSFRNCEEMLLMKKMSKKQIVMLILIVVIILVGIVYGVINYQRKVYMKKCEEAKQEMINIAEKYVDALNNHDYDAAVSLLSDSCKEYYKDLDTMYAFVEEEDCDFSEPIDYNEFTFAIDEMDDSMIDFGSDPDMFEKELLYGVDFGIEFGDSKNKYIIGWNMSFVVEDDEIKIDEISRLYD